MRKRLAGIIMGMMLLLVGCQGVGASEIVVKINHEPIEKSVYMLYLHEAVAEFDAIGGKDIWETDFDGRSAQTLVKERALESLQTVVLTAQQAEGLGIVLSEQEKEQAKVNAKNELAKLTEEEQKEIGITEKSMVQIMEETLLYQRVIEEITQDYQPSDADFNAYFSKNKENSFHRYIRYSINSILVPDQATAEFVAKSARSGTDFHSLFLQYESNEAERKSGGLIEAYQWQLQTIFGTDFFPVEGEIQGPIETPEGYFILQTKEKEEPTEKILRENMHNEYVTTRKRELFQEEYAGWLAKAVMEREQKVWDAITITP